MHAVQPCKGLRDLSTDADHREHGRNHKTKVQCEGKEIADSHLAGQNQTASGDHDGDANDPHQQGRRETNHRSRKQRPPDILKEAEGAGFKYGGLAFFRVKAFDHAHTSKRFRQASGDLGVDLSALTENRANRSERFAQNQAEDE